MSLMGNQQLRMISSKAFLRKNNSEVKLRGKFLQGRQADLPTMIWFSDLVESAENFEAFFTKGDNKILNVRNVWLVNYRNFGDSDHHESFDMNDISNDVVRFMDDNKLTMATLGGHGFGAKVALATAINNLDRCTGVINLDGGPLDHTHYEAYQEVKEYVDIARKTDLSSMDINQATRYLKEEIACSKWSKIFAQGLEAKGDKPTWKFNIDGLW